MADFQELADNVYAGKKDKVEEIVNQALEEGCSAKEILEQGLIKGMTRVGEDFKNNRIYVPEVLIAARAMKAGMAIIKPKFADEKVEPKGRVAIGTVKGDVHSIGKSLVAMMLENVGFEVHDLGVDVPPEEFVSAIKEHKPEIVGLSGLLSEAVESMKRTVEAVKEAGLRDSVKIIIGGGIVDESVKEIKKILEIGKLGNGMNPLLNKEGIGGVEIEYQRIAALLNC